MASMHHASQPETIRKMFSAISGRYDQANTVLSLGIHHRWRKALVRLSGARNGHQILDCASGTGDLAFEFEKAVGPAGSVIGTDFCEDMLVQARRKASDRSSRASFEVADATNLPFFNGQFDFTSIAFGIRNVSNPSQALAEMGRVTRPGGAVLVLEFGQPGSRVWGSLFGFYSRVLLPRMGGWLTGNPEAYQYLQKSSAAFPCGDDFLEMAKGTGMFDDFIVRPLSGGVAYLYRLRRKAAE